MCCCGGKFRIFRGCWRIWWWRQWWRGWACSGSRKRGRASLMSSSDMQLTGAMARGDLPGAAPPAVRVEHLGKCYQIYEQPRDRFKQLFTRVTHRNYYREFWALRDVSFSVKRGETVGVIG